MTTERFEVQKLQHPIKTRLLRVKRIVELSPSMRRITLTGDDLHGFHSAGFDDHVKLMVPPTAGVTLHIPDVGPNGLIFAEDQPKPAMRDYTPRRYDPAANELDIDFVLHHEGPATDWAAQVKLGHAVGIAGPRGSFVIPTTFDWHLLIGDETALPAIGRRLEELPGTTRAIVVVKLLSDDGKLALSGSCSFDVHWVVDSGPGATGELEAAMRRIDLPEGEGYVWAGGEYSDIKAVRRYLTENLGIDKSRIRASSYWRRAGPNTDKHFN